MSIPIFLRPAKTQQIFNLKQNLSNLIGWNSNNDFSVFLANIQV